MDDDQKINFDLDNYVRLAQRNTSKIDFLVQKYMPFIKKTAHDINNTNSLEYDDALSIAMIAFVNAIQSFDAERSSFITFAKICIRNRIIDEIRKSVKNSSNVIPLYTQNYSDDLDTRVSDSIAISAYNLETEQTELKQEIDSYDHNLSEFGIRFDDLVEIGPKHKKSKRQCYAIAFYIANDLDMYNYFTKTKHLKQSELAIKFGISKKTIEKHRKYIVSLVVLIKGDYPAIKTFIPAYRESIEI